MKCPTCGTWTEVLETRTNPESKRRRYECANHHRFTTREAITEDTTTTRNHDIVTSALSAKELAAVYNISRQRVYSIRKEYRNAGHT